MTITAKQIAALDSAATQGKWRQKDGGVLRRDDEPYIAVCVRPEHNDLANADLIVALVNGYRDRSLVHVDEVEKLRAALVNIRDEARKSRANPDAIFAYAMDALEATQGDE